MNNIHNSKKSKIMNYLLLSCLIFCISCNSSTSDSSDDASDSQDITNVSLTSRNPDCSYYANNYTSSINYIKENTVYSEFDGSLAITYDSADQTCTF